MSGILLIFRLRRRRAVSTLIGGMIVLVLLLTALGTMVFVSQQYDQYQQIVNKMAQYHNQQQSEELVANSPGLTVLTPGTQNCPASGYNCYSMTVSNVGAVGVQITTIYINSTTGSGCIIPNPQPCILNPSSATNPYSFQQSARYLNPGETKHIVILYLPSTVTLPNPTPGFPRNTVFIITSRGNVFPFQWPFQPLIGGQSLSAFSFGVMKIAYQCTTYSSGVCSSGGYDSIHDYQGASGQTTGTYCHGEALQNYPAASNYAEQLSVPSANSGVLTFVNPWIIQKIFDASDTLGDYTQTTWLYIYADVVNTGNTAYTISSGSIDLTWSGSDHLDASLLGTYYNGHFYATASTPPSIAPGTSYYVIFKMTTITLGVSGGTWPPANQQSAMFWGSASLTDNAEDQSYFAGTILLSGLWVRASC